MAFSGCANMSGLSGSSDYACKAPEGVTCDSVSGTYANAIHNNLPSQRPRSAAPGSARGSPALPAPGTVTLPPVPASASPALGSPRNSSFRAQAPATPIPNARPAPQASAFAGSSARPLIPTFSRMS